MAGVGERQNEAIDPSFDSQFRPTLRPDCHATMQILHLRAPPGARAIRPTFSGESLAFH